MFRRLNFIRFKHRQKIVAPMYASKIDRFHGSVIFLRSAPFPLRIGHVVRTHAPLDRRRVFSEAQHVARVYGGRTDGSGLGPTS